MKLYYTTDFEGHYPVGVGAVAWAHNMIEAKILLGLAIQKHGLDGGVGDVKEVPTLTPIAFVLCDGNY